MSEALTRAVDEAAAGAPDPSLTRSQLPQVMHDSPATVLLVDRSSAQVVRINPAGSALLDPELALPLAVDQWCRQTGLTGEVPQSALERIVSGDTLSGQLVHSTDRAWWLTGFPLPPREQDPALSLVVLLPVQPGSDGPMNAEGRAGAEVRDRAVVAAGLSFTISDPRLPDNPLVFVNPAFERTTGYAPADVEGLNCRFLQGPGTDPAAVQRIREILAERSHESVTLLNYRRDGTAFWNEVSLSPVYDGAGELTHFVGIQADVTTRVSIEVERQRHLQAEREARAKAERAEGRFALMADATHQLAMTLDVDESLDRLTALAVPVLADFCTVHLLGPDGPDGPMEKVRARHRDSSHDDALRRLEGYRTTGLSEASNTGQVLRGGPPRHVRIDEAVLASSVVVPELREIYRELGASSALIVPLQARRQVLGVLALFADGSGRVFSDDDLETAADLGRRAAVTVDNARLYQREHQLAEGLQRSLLPVLPEIDGLDRDARYLPGATAAQVGGDWYDLLQLPDGTVGVAIGDVMGHDLSAAASMGQLRSVLQSYAWQGSSPAVVLDRLDQLVQGLAMAQLATCVYARLTLPDGASPGRIRLANAGHPPPALRGPDGTVRLLGTSDDLLVGAELGTTRSEVEEIVEPGSVLVLYTDGLVEQRGRSLDEGLEALAAALAAAPETGAGQIADFVLDELSGGESLDDDVALLVVRVLRSSTPQ